MHLDKLYKILLVDDDQDILDVVTINIKSEIIAKLLIHESCNAEDAMNLASKNTYDLVITDYKLPKLNGDELIRYLRQATSNKSCPILFISGFFTELELPQGDESFNKIIFIDKPFEITELINHIKTQLKI